MLKPVELGYLEPCADERRLLSPFFPSKFGGKPAWLAPTGIPSAEQLNCSQCGQPMLFLLQAYAPLDDDPAAFHRVVYIFLCRNSACWKPGLCTGSIRAIRCQLPRQNDFYSSEPMQPGTPDGDAAVAKLADTYDRLCTVCGIWAPHLCGQCKRVRYCSKTHQKHHWNAVHKQACGQGDQEEQSSMSLLFPEFEMVTYVERFFEESKGERSEAQRMEEYRRYAEMVKDNGKKKGDGKKSYTVEELESLSKEVDKDFKRFRKRLEQNPRQIIRYQLGGEPLLASRLQPDAIPKCQNCGAMRRFEFQIMPHLLSFMAVDEMSAEGIDWATVCIYTCSKNCESSEKDYYHEYAWKQDYNV